VLSGCGWVVSDTDGTKPKIMLTYQPILLGGNERLSPFCMVLDFIQSANSVRRSCKEGFFIGGNVMSAKAQIGGMRFGKLTAIDQDGSRNNKALCNFRCDCGKVEKRAYIHVKRSNRKGIPQCKECMFAMRGETGKRNKTHGFSNGNTRKLYDVHRQMMKRCYDSACKDYPNYGERGISVCQEWHDLGSFINWAYSTGYKEKVTIERIDVNGNYCPENCTWIKNAMQAQNTRKVIRLDAFGETRLLLDWAVITGIGYRTIKTRLRLGWDVERALTEKPYLGKNQFS
jgi:hypothetical protein